MRILYVHSLMFNQLTWSRVSEKLAREGLDLVLIPQMSWEKAAAELASGKVDLFLAELSQSQDGFDELMDLGGKAAQSVGLGEEVPAGWGDFSDQDRALLRSYVARVSEENYLNGIRFAASACGADVEYDSPQEVLTGGVFHPYAEKAFTDREEYLGWLTQVHGLDPDRPLVGLVCYYSQVAERNTAEIDALIKALEDHGFRPLCVFCEGLADAGELPDRRHPWFRYFLEAGGKPAVLLNLLSARFLSREDEIGLLKELDRPVIQLLRVHNQTPEEWLADEYGLSATSLVYGLAQPEMAGTIEPTVIAARRPGSEALCYEPIPERIGFLCRRIKRWLALAEKPNKDKRVTVVLHNAPCQGVEATIGTGVGLNVFDSLARLLQAMDGEGYDVGRPPATGAELKELIVSRKAVSEFRWTTPDEIVAKGGVLHFVDQEEYRTYLETLPRAIQEKVVQDWDPFPGQAMVYEREGEPTLLVTGIQLGQTKIMLQPKRGCYGAKCNGEVCRILHDPLISPPHHWLATYNYIDRTSDAVIHFGCEGALEYLPGKRAGLSEMCFPDISLNTLPNLYVYIMDVVGEGLIAKRRGRAVLVDHLGPAYRPALLDSDAARTEDLLVQFQRARAMDEPARARELAKELRPLLAKLGFFKDKAEEIEPGSGQEEEAMDLAARALAQAKQTLAPTGLHCLGQPPDPEETVMMLTSILRQESPGRPSLEEVAGRSTSRGEVFDRAAEVVRSALKRSEADWEALWPGEEGSSFREWCRKIAGLLARSHEEMAALLHGLDGGFIPPGPSGSLLLGQTQALPTGRNFFGLDVTRLPTRAAWAGGQDLADRLLRKYLEDGGEFPRTVGLSLWSSDGFKSDGELCCQILHLMGFKPVWDGDGRCRKVEPIPLDGLLLDGNPRPRIDVVIQTSSLVRDMLPNFIDLIDKAALAASDLDEPTEKNHIRAHTLERMAALKKELGEQSAGLFRSARYRVFSARPGSHTLGVGLVLDASAWNERSELAETYVEHGGYALGSDGDHGELAPDHFAALLSKVDATAMRQYSPEYDLTGCGCYASFLGGMAVAAESLSGKKARLYWMDDPSGGESEVRDFRESLEASARAKVLNQNWIEVMKKEGFQGAARVMAQVSSLFKWSATTEAVEGRILDAVAGKLILDRDNLDWLRQENPFALEEITRRLMEAASRGLWSPDPEVLARVQSAALAVEGDMEESMGRVEGEFQGSQVEVLTADQVEKWQKGWHMEPRAASGE